MYAGLPSLNALRAFESVARHLSFARAAQELHVTPAAVKQLVSKLEAALGQRLIARQGRDLFLTEAGLAGRAALSDGLRQMAHAVDTMRPNHTRRRLMVSTDPFFAATWLVPRLNRFRDKYPETDVLIDSSMAICDLARGDADIAIRYGVTGEDTLLRTRLFEDRILPLCSPRLINQPPFLSKTEDLARTTLLHWDLSSMPWARATSYWFSFETWFQQTGAGKIEAAHNLHFSDYNLAVQAAIAGQGVVLGSWPILREAMEARLLEAPFEYSLSTDIGYDLVMTRAAQHNAESRDFTDWLLQEAQSEPQLSNRRDAQTS